MGAAGEDDQPGVIRASMIQLVRLEGEPPEGFDALVAEAEAEGHRHLTRLKVELSEAAPFTAILAAFHDGDLVGVGALTPEPADPARQRMRRFYVAPRARRLGVARALANALLQEALQHTRHVTVHAGEPQAAWFWEAMGYAPVDAQPWSHVYAG